jgi:hypothetical protein
VCKNVCVCREKYCEHQNRESVCILKETVCVKVENKLGIRVREKIAQLRGNEER